MCPVNISSKLPYPFSQFSLQWNCTVNKKGKIASDGGWRILAYSANRWEEPCYNAKCGKRRNSIRIVTKILFTGRACLHKLHHSHHFSYLFFGQITEDEKKAVSFTLLLSEIMLKCCTSCFKEKHTDEQRIKTIIC